MSHYIIYHNARCSKSRGAHQILEEAGVDFEERFYLEQPPTEEELTKIISLLHVSPIDIVRTGEEEWKSSELDEDVADEEIISFITQHPQVLQRPIVVKDDREAVIGRPPKNIKELL